MNALAKSVEMPQTEWRRRLVMPMIPPGEGAGMPLSVRYPKALVERIDACAKETGNSRTDTILHLLRWALSRYEEERALEKQAKK